MEKVFGKLMDITSKSIAAYAIGTGVTGQKGLQLFSARHNRGK
jgi:hypothetical protein